LIRNVVRHQRTLAADAALSGIGLHSGQTVRLRMLPAGADTGVLFKRTDLDGSPSIRPDLENVNYTTHQTSIIENGVEVLTVEHLLAASYGMGIDNLVVEMNGPEVPIMDGSAQPFVEAFRSAGIVELDEVSKPRALNSPLKYTSGDVSITAVPSGSLTIAFGIQYDHPYLFSQYARHEITPEAFSRELAPARTYSFREWVEPLREKGLIKGGSLENAILIGDKDIVNEEPLRFSDEFARHKIADMVGNIAMMGFPIAADIYAFKSGHLHNVEFLRLLKREMTESEAPYETFEIGEILRIMPHRYPFILVDRILELGEDRVVGIKNVTINEPFFQGHFPGHPVMPGVLIVESMAQIGGFLLLHKVDNPEGKVVYFTKIEDVKFRKVVTPGDQIRSVLKMIKFRKNLCIIKGQAFVGGDLVCEGMLTAMVVQR
jgi:UDP-3-O-[3-hydroxymyristoyl] N-acetylglucosamine deacetylase/3-hydroxyacyl-[acyl-carrier-protein] dehydratase